MILSSCSWSGFARPLACPFFDPIYDHPALGSCIDVAAQRTMVGDRGDRWFALGDFAWVHDNGARLLDEVLIDSTELDLLSGSFVDGPAPGRAAGDSE